MKDVLRSVCMIPGVTGCALFSIAGDCLINRLPEPYEPILVRQILAEVSSVFQVVSCADNGTPEQCIVALEDGVFVVQQLAGLPLAVFGTHALDTKKLRVGCNVASMKIKEHKVSQSSRSAESRYQYSEETADKDGATVVSTKRMRSLVAQLTTYVGPAAKTIVKRRCRKLGATTRTLPRALLGALIVQLSTQIADDNQRAQFLTEMYDLMAAQVSE